MKFILLTENIKWYIKNSPSITSYQDVGFEDDCTTS